MWKLKTNYTGKPLKRIPQPTAEIIHRPEGIPLAESLRENRRLSRFDKFIDTLARQNKVKYLNIK